MLDRLTSIYGRGQVYIEIQRHQQREEESRNQALMSLAAQYRLPVIATNGVRHAEPKDRELLDVLTAIRHHTSLDKAGRLLTANARRFLHTPEEMEALFRDVPDAIANSRMVSERLDFMLDDDSHSAGNSISVYGALNYF